VLGIGGAYAQGTMAIGAGFQGAYQEGPYSGTYHFEGSPRTDWQIFQVSAELRVGWKLGTVRPYVGLGFGYNFGEINGSTQLTATLTSNQGMEIQQPPSFSEEPYTTKPARFTIRPQLGLDLVFGIFALTAQVELAVMAQEQLGQDLDAELTGIIQAGENLLYNEAAKGTAVSAALVSTHAMRFQF